MSSDRTLFEYLPNSFSGANTHRHLVITNVPRPSDQSRICDIFADGLEALDSILLAFADLTDRQQTAFAGPTLKLHAQLDAKTLLDEEVFTELDELIARIGVPDAEDRSLERMLELAREARRLANRVAYLIAAECEIAARLPKPGQTSQATVA
ncbi:hypothetical protein V8J36_22780 [Frigidibacter sp. MR17.14]|uniref:hypothetical protein n=1 Tax=Frigidibacter sp. MR17.14 TaxID=3126509 RepID=UPI003012F467